MIFKEGNDKNEKKGIDRKKKAERHAKSNGYRRHRKSYVGNSRMKGKKIKKIKKEEKTADTIAANKSSFDKYFPQ